MISKTSMRYTQVSKYEKKQCLIFYFSKLSALTIIISGYILRPYPQQSQHQKDQLHVPEHNFKSGPILFNLMSIVVVLSTLIAVMRQMVQFTVRAIVLYVTYVGVKVSTASRYAVTCVSYLRTTSLQCCSNQPVQCY